MNKFLSWLLFGTTAAVVFLTSARDTSAFECSVKVPFHKPLPELEHTVPFEDVGLLVFDKDKIYSLKGHNFIKINQENIDLTGLTILFLDRDSIIFGSNSGLYYATKDQISKIEGSHIVSDVEFASNKINEVQLFLEKDNLFLLKDEVLRQVQNSEETKDLKIITEIQESYWLVSTSGGVFKTSNGVLEPLISRDEISGEIGFVTELTNDSYLLYDDDYLYLVKKDRIDKIKLRSKTNFISDFGPVGENLRLLYSYQEDLILFDLENPQRLKFIPLDPPTNDLMDFESWGNEKKLLVGDSSFYIFERNSVSSIPINTKLEWLGHGISLDDHAHLWFNNAGLFKIDYGSISIIPSNIDTGEISSITKLGGNEILVGTEKGLFYYEDEALIFIDDLDVTLNVYRFIPTEKEGLIVVSNLGLHSFKDGKLIEIAIGEAFSESFLFEESDNKIIISSRDGLYLLNANTLTKIPSSAPLSDAQLLSETSDGNPILAATEGYFVFFGNSNVQLSEEPQTYKHIQSDETETVFWNISHQCAFALVADNFSVLVDDKTYDTPIFLSPSNQVDRIRVQADFNFKQVTQSTKSAQLQYRSNLKEDNWDEISGSEIELRIGWTFWKSASETLKSATIWLGLFHFFAFTSLIVGARWSRWCWRVLTDKFWGRLGLWFWFVVRHIAPVQRWLLARWYDDGRAKVSHTPYLPMPLTGLMDAAIPSSNLVAHLSPHRKLWLHAGAGMGKTILIDVLAEQYSKDQRTLSASFARWGFVPLFIKLRDYVDLVVPEATPENWIFDLAAAEFEKRRFNITDRELLKSILTQGYFVIVLDGANEVDDGGAIKLFAQKNQDIGLLVTSQTELASSSINFVSCELPKRIDEAIAPLLTLYLKEEKGAETYAVIKDSPVFDHIVSGYDVRLLADLVEAEIPLENLPQTRTGLYDAMLDQARSVDASRYPVDQLCQAAWKLWVGNKREFMPGTDVDTGLIKPLEDGRIRIVRTLDGHLFEFRHDQMRGYLAARWAALHEVAPIALFEQDDTIWRLGGSEQAVVWGFFADLIGQSKGEEIWRWSTEKAERAELQAALRDVGTRDGWCLTVTSNQIAEAR